MSTKVKSPTSVSSGLNNMNSTYALTRALMSSLLSELNNNNIFGNQVSKLFSSPIDNIVSLHCFPFNIKTLLLNAYPSLSSADSDIQISVVRMTTQGFYIGLLPCPVVDLGSYAISRHFNNFLDYSPYTKIELYLPYIGFEVLDTDVVMGNTIGIKYAIDLMTGKCTAYVSLVDGTDETVILVRDGQCGSEIQVAGGDGAALARNMLRVAVGATTGALGLAGGALGGASAGKVLSGGAGLISSTTTAVLNGLQYDVKKGGSSSSFNSKYAPQNAYLIFTRPTVVEPSTYAHTFGYPSGATKTLSSLTGFTQVEKVHVEGAGFERATANELTEIDTLLKSGVIF